MDLTQCPGACLKLKLMLIVALVVQPLSSFAVAESIATVKAVRLVPAAALSKVSDTSGWVLSAEFDVFLGFKLQEAAERGLPLNFSVDFQLIRPRWYWSDKRVVTLSLPIELSYHALTRTYRLQKAGAVLIFSSLNEALAAMSRLSYWRVVRHDQVELGQRYVAKVRFSLDMSEMPKPFQVNALTNSQWELASDWLEFEFLPKSEELR